MPNHDYRCTECGWILRDQYRSIEVGGQGDPPFCYNCETRMDWIPAAQFDLMSDGTTFPKFTTTDARGNRVEISTLHQVRQIERDSEVAARNGEGQQMVFRAFAQSKGNKLDGTLGSIPEPALTAAAKAKFGLRGGATPIAAGPDGAPDIPYGPGVNDSNASALKG